MMSQCRKCVLRRDCWIKSVCDGAMPRPTHLAPVEERALLAAARYECPCREVSE